MLALGEPASAVSCKRYRAVDLGPIPDPSAFNAPEFGDNTFGINGNGEVVFVIDVDPSPSVVLHAVVWLPRPAYNLSAGLHDLHTLSSPPLPHLQSVATDINDAGIIVGLTGNAIGDPRARAWRLDQYTTGGGLPHLDLHTTTGQRSIAHGINNITPRPRVVGYAEFPCTGNPSVFLDRAFHIPILGTSAMLELAPAPAPTGQSILSYALAVNSLSIAIGGRDDLLPSVQEPCMENPVGQFCHPPFMDPVKWVQLENFHPNLMPRLGPAPPTGMGGGTEARGVNNNGEFAGVAVEAFDVQTDCRPRAVMWIPQPFPLDELLVNLHSIAGIPADFESRADAISDPTIRGFIRVVGANLTANRAMVWERAPGPPETWCARVLLDNVSAPAVDDVGLSCVWDDASASCMTDIRIERAHDVTVGGIVIGYGLRTSTPLVLRAYLLTCRSDIHNGAIKADMRVDGADQGQLLLHWGTCPGGVCPEDLNDDGIVDGTDLGILLSDWSPDNPCDIQTPLCETCGGGAGAMASGGGEIEEAGWDDSMSAAALEEALWMIGFESIEAYVAWALEASPDEAASYADVIHSLLTDS